MFNSPFVKILVAAFLLYLTWKFQIVDLLIFPSSIGTWKIPGGTSIIEFSPNGEMLATRSGELTDRLIPRLVYKRHVQGNPLIEIRKISNGSTIKTLEFFAASSIAFSSDNSLFAAGSYGGEVKVWRINDGQLIYSLIGADRSDSETRFLGFTNDGSSLVAWAKASLPERDDDRLTVWNISNGEKRYSLSGKYRGVAISPDGQTLAIGNTEQPITLHRLSDGTLEKQLETTTKRAFDLRFTPDGKLLACRTNVKNEGIPVYRVEDGKLLHLFSSRIQPFLDKESLTNFALSPDGRYLAASYDVKMSDGFLFGGVASYRLTSHGRIRVWQLATGLQIQTLRGHEWGTNALAFTPDGKMLISAGGDGTIRFWRFPPQYPVLVWLLMITGVVFAVRYWRRWHFMRSLRQID
jgi:WD40 repeat protein